MVSIQGAQSWILHTLTNSKVVEILEREITVRYSAVAPPVQPVPMNDIVCKTPHATPSKRYRCILRLMELQHAPWDYAVRRAL